MNSNNPIRNYKHDISGKFKDITTAITAMDENLFNDPENNEIFHAIHEVLLKMIKTSRNTMLENLKQEIILVVSDAEPNTTLDKLQIQGITLRYEMSANKMTYFYFKGENEGDTAINTGIICTMLPVRGIENEFEVTKKDIVNNVIPQGI